MFLGAGATCRCRLFWLPYTLPPAPEPRLTARRALQELVQSLGSVMEGARHAFAALEGARHTL